MTVLLFNSNANTSIVIEPSSGLNSGEVENNSKKNSLTLCLFVGPNKGDVSYTRFISFRLIAPHQSFNIPTTSKVYGAL